MVLSSTVGAMVYQAVALRLDPDQVLRACSNGGCDPFGVFPIFPIELDNKSSRGGNRPVTR
jgi:hypothetical protein